MKNIKKKRIKNAKYPHFLRQNESLFERNIKCIFFNMLDAISGRIDRIGIDHDGYRRSWFNRNMRMNVRRELVESLEPYKDQAEIAEALNLLSDSDDYSVNNDHIFLIWEHVSNAINNQEWDNPLVEIERKLSELYKVT
ncbi:TPA: hypothetical protein ACX3G9_004355 [Vibrio parahaemolyticus]